MLFGYLQTWYCPGESRLLPLGILLILLGMLLGGKIAKEKQGTMIVGSVLLFLVLSLLQNMFKSAPIGTVLLYFTGAAVSLLGGMLLRDILAFFRTR
jgi:predicted MFS family arabinose efflux permease